MAKIAEYLKQILSARYGRDVRQSIHDAISAINDESTECWATVEKVPETLAIAAVKDRVSGKDVTLPLSSDFVATDFKAKGNTEQDTTSGKNLLDCSGLTEQTINGVTFTPKYSETEEDVKKGYPLGSLMYINANGTATATSEYIFIINPMLPEGDLILSGCPSGGSNETYSIQYSNNTDFAYREFGSGVTIQQFNYEDYPATSVKIRVLPNTVCNNLKFYPMIRYAENGDDTYEPFTNGASPNPHFPQPLRKVVLSEIRTYSKNTFDFDNIVFTKNVSAEYTKDDSKITITATANAFSGIYCFPFYKGFAGYTMTMSADVTISNGVNVLFGSSSKQQYISLTPNVKKRISITTTVGASDAFVIYNGQALEKTITVENIQFEFGSTATDYEHFAGKSVATLSNPITLNGLNGVQDYVDVKCGVEHHNFKTVVFDGSDDEGWGSISLGGTYNRDIFYVTLSDYNFISSSTLNYMCDALKAIPHSERYVENAMFIESLKRLCCYPKDFTTLADWKAHLASKPMEVTYELAEPIETPLPDVEALKNIRTFKGTTHIFTDSGVKPDLEVEYVIDTKLYIDAKFKELS